MPIWQVFWEIDLGETMSTYAEYKLIEEAKEELKKAFRANAALRATKVELEKKLKKIRDRLMEQKAVDKILETPKFKKLEILKEKGFLSDIEKEVAQEHAAAQKRSVRREKEGSKRARKQLSVQEKQSFLVEFVKKNKDKEELTLADIQREMRSTGIKSQVQAFLKTLNLPQDATEPAGPARRDGTNFYPKNIPWLKEHIG